MATKRRGKLGDNPLAALGTLSTSPSSTWDRKHRVTGYRIPREITEKIKAIAQQEGVPISQVASYALADWLRRYEQGQAALPTQEVVKASRAVVLPM